MINTNAVRAVFRRQFGSLLGNPLGYVFILAFVLVSAGFLFVPDAYFARNIADFGPLLDIMPWLLVVLLPALAMGTWASERELGTEEQLLTLPMTELDAVLGKWLGVAAFLTVALGCSLSNVVVLLWLGDPDVGLVLANYAGWWFAGLAFAAVSVFASTLVGLPAIAYVLGTLFSAAVMALADGLDWFDPFNRGVVAVGPVGMSLAVVALGLGLAVLVLSSRRWQPSSRPQVVTQWITALALGVSVVNVAVLVDRAAVDVDTTTEGLSSLSGTSLDVLGQIERPVTINAFLSRSLPPELAVKGKEVENKLKVLDREMGDKVRLKLYRPADPLDEAGSLATQHFGLRPRPVVVDTVAGKETQEVFLGVAVTSGSRTERIDHFDPGLSVEYELVRTIRMVGSSARKVLGIVKTDLDMVGGFDYAARRMKPEWALVTEWKKQYEVRPVDLDAPVGDDVDVLVAPQPSRLAEEQIRRLHDYIWDGRPALILEDPLPIFSGAELASSQPKGGQQQQSPFGGPPPGGGENGDLRPLVRALGVDMDLAEIAWSAFNPSHEFRNRWPPSLVWCFRDGGAVIEATATTGIDSLLLPWPGIMRPAADRDPGLEVKTLAAPTTGVPWGAHRYDQHFQRHPFFGMQKVTPEKDVPDEGPQRALAVSIRGPMKRAYPFPKPPREEGDDPEEPEPEPEPEDDAGVGAVGAKPIHVIFVADTDLAHDQFFTLYRNQDDAFSADDLKFLTNLRNVQFLGNAVDALAEDADFLELRTRRPRDRPLSRLQSELEGTLRTVSEAQAKAQTESEAKIAKLQADFEARLAKLDDTPGLDENAKKQLKEQERRSAQRQLDVDIEAIHRETEERTRAAKIEQKRAIEAARDQVRVLAMGVPAGLLALLAIAVFAHRMKGERLTVPASRQRSES